MILFDEDNADGLMPSNIDFDEPFERLLPWLDHLQQSDEVLQD